MDQLLSIGQFSARCRLSPKALRLYAELGLVVPVRVDADSGYRWYAPTQLDRARLVGLLRGMEMPLAQIAELIDRPGPQAAALVRRFVREASRAHQGRVELADYVCLLLDEGSTTMTIDVQVRTIAARAVLSGIRRAHADQLEQVLGDLLGQLRRSGPGLPGIEGCPYTVYYAEVTADSDGPVEVVRPMADYALAQRAAATMADVQARIEPEHDEAYVRMTMGQIRGAAHHEVLAGLQRFLASAGRDVTLPPRQVMIADWRTAGANDPAADLAIPLRAVG